MGIAAEDLKGHPAMQGLLARLQHRAELARENLTEHDPDDTAGIRGLQTEVKLFKTLVNEIDAMIVEGRVCEQELQEEGEDDE